MKGLLIIADGLGGRPTDRNGLTCLEAASTPNLDTLAERGALGLMDPIRPGIRPGSDTAHLSLLGYDPRALYTGRGVFECLGAGLAVQPGDICFRANLATVERTTDGFVVVDRRAGRIETGQSELAEAINTVRLKKTSDVTHEFVATTQHRGALLLRGENLSRYITENDPHDVGRPAHRIEPAKRGDPAALRTADALNELIERAYDVLDRHPVNDGRRSAGEPAANFLLARGAADCPHIESVTSIYGARAAVVAGGALYRGVALACGMEVIRVPEATGGLDTDLGAKARAALSALETYDVVFLHVKGTDNAGHDQDAAAKTGFIERIDRELFGTLMQAVDRGDLHVAFTGDHTTPIDYGDHTPDPVPVLFVGPNVAVDETKAFGEREAGRGGLGRFSGQVLPMLMGYNNRAPKYGS